MERPKPEVKDFTPPLDPADVRTPFERFESFAKRIFSVPKREIDDQRAKEEQQESHGDQNG